MTNNIINLDPTTPSQPIAPWVGGKRLLAKRIIEVINQVNHKIYVEPFTGMGGIFFRRDKAPRVEVINDINNNLINLFNIIKHHPDELMKELRYLLHSRTAFERYKLIPDEALTDIQRSSKFLYSIKSSFAGFGNNFGIDLKGGARFKAENLQPKIDALHKRLERAIIENLDYSKLIKKYDRKETLFYLDPPYYNTEDYYGKNIFQKDDFQTIAHILTTIKGKFILSINDTPEIRTIFQAFNFQEVTTKYSISSSGTRDANELLITNY